MISPLFLYDHKLSGAQICQAICENITKPVIEYQHSAKIHQFCSLSSSQYHRVVIVTLLSIVYTELSQ